MTDGKAPAKEGERSEPLKPCPFCGGHESPTLKNVAGGGNCVQCIECGCETNVEDNAFEAVAAWNLRSQGEGDWDAYSLLHPRRR